jgi:4-hydroxy-4-methyl-2-oxoglutarate aldolase
MDQESFRRQLDTLKRIGTATVHEALGQRGAVDGRISPLDPATRMAGRAYTVDSRPSDNLMLHYALTQAVPGDVLVVDAKGFLGAAAWGDVMTFAARKAGLAGLVIDGAVRDASAIVEMGFPVFCRGLSIHGPTKNQPGKVNVPVVVGGCQVNPGDIIVGDRDGIVVVPAAELEKVVALGEERERKEATVRQRLDEGMSTVELFGLTETLKKWGFN